MRDIMAASFYRFKKSRDLFYAILVAILIGTSLGFSTYVQNEEIRLSVIGSIDTWMFMSFLIIMIFITAYLAGDFRNKTIYYEIMSGHSSSEIVIGRMIPIVIFSIIILSVELIGTYSFGIIWGGWGTVIGSFREGVIRWFLLMCNALPFIVLCMFSIYLTKTVVGGLVLDWLMWIIIQIPLFLVTVVQWNISNFSLVINMRRIMETPLDYLLCLSIIGISMIKVLFIVVISIWVLKRSDLK